MNKKMFLRVRDPREDSKRIAYGQCVKAVSFLEIEENGRYPFLQMEVCAEKITAIDSKLIIHLDMPFRSAAFIKELVIHNCTWGHTRHQKSPLQVDTILELLGPSSTIQRLNLMLIDEKLKSFEILISRLRHLERLDITFPDTTTILEMSDLLFLGG